jgi:SAM-dependent methyltransferase
VEHSESRRIYALIFEQYARYYDMFYQDKDYDAECDFLEKIFEANASKPVRSILDLGCGTGGHAIPLARRGYSVTGVDLSTQMLSAARSKSAEAGLAIELVEGDARQIYLSHTFDAVIAMFAVMSYQTSNADLEAVIQTARRQLLPGGLFVFDAWFGPAVLSERPTDRYRSVENSDERIHRFAHPELNVVTQTVVVNYHVLRIRAGQLLEELTEAHSMRFLFVQEIAYLLERNGFRFRQACPFLELGRELTERDWNMTVIAEAT